MSLYLRTAVHALRSLLSPSLCKRPPARELNCSSKSCHELHPNVSRFGVANHHAYDMYPHASSSMKQKRALDYGGSLQATLSYLLSPTHANAASTPRLASPLSRSPPRAVDVPQLLGTNR